MSESENAFSALHFLRSVTRIDQLPPEELPELAFAGRSNVGKSSAINALARRRRLAFFSKTPGRTQALNFYELPGRARFVDLPGYGFARAPRTMRASWDRLVGGYLASRRALVGVVVLIDARRPFGPQDELLLDWLRPEGRRVLVLLAKCDKLSRAEQEARLREARERLSRDVAARVLLFSSTTGVGVTEAREQLETWLKAARALK